MKIMITGATGFIGNQLLNRLIGNGDQINLLCRSEKIIFRNIPDVRVFSGDITDSRSIELCMDGCDQVYHLAAYARNWAKNKKCFFESNTRAVENILMSGINQNVKKILFMSTSVTFGPSGSELINENKKRIVAPFTMYETSKVEAEKIVLRYLDKGLNTVTVNPTRLFGPGLLTEGNSVTKMIELFLKGKFRFILGDGNAIGNYAFIDDVVRGCINAMNQGKIGEKYILGGENLSYKDFFYSVSKTSGKNFRMIHIPEFVGLSYSYLEKLLGQFSNHYPSITPDWVRTFAVNWAFSSDKASSEIGYKITPFNDALWKTINWILKNNNKQGVENESIKFA